METCEFLRRSFLNGKSKCCLSAARGASETDRSLLAALLPRVGAEAHSPQSEGIDERAPAGRLQVALTWRLLRHEATARFGYRQNATRSTKHGQRTALVHLLRLPVIKASGGCRGETSRGPSMARGKQHQRMEMLSRM